MIYASSINSIKTVLRLSSVYGWQSKQRTMRYDFRFVGRGGVERTTSGVVSGLRKGKKSYRTGWVLPQSKIGAQWNSWRRRIRRRKKMALFMKRIINFQQMIRCKGVLHRKDWRIINLLLVSGLLSRILLSMIVFPRSRPQWCITCWVLRTPTSWNVLDLSE